MRFRELPHASALERRERLRRCLTALVALAPLSLGGCTESKNPLIPDTGGSETTTDPTDPSSTSATPSPETGSSEGGESESGPSIDDLPPSVHLDHCLYGHPPHPSDSDPAMVDGPADFYPPGVNDPNLVDTTVQPQVLDYMYENAWQVAHIEWHAIRGCRIPGGAGISHVDICRFEQLIPENQNCQTAGDGYEFLAFHRHMIQALKQLWPKHSEQFTGFTEFPDSADDVPEQWRSAWRDWDAQALEAGRIGDNIADPENLARFPDEGTLGFWLQCAVGQRLMNPANNMPFVGLHFLLHAKWARPGNTTHGVNNTEANIDNYMFWKLHGWIDTVWEKYRVAKGLTPDEPKLQAEMVKQCQEMDTYIRIIKEELDPDTLPDPNAPLPDESGFFHEQVRPIFENQVNLCSGCHAETGANGRLTLGGHVSSRDIVDGLVNVPSRAGGQYLLVVPGDPDNSWLYLKASDLAKTAGCTPTDTAQCIDGVMPPSMSGPTVSPAQLQTLRQWIQDGAEGPI